MDLLQQLMMLTPFVILCIWYLLDKSQKDYMLNKIASGIGPYHLCLDGISETTKNSDSFKEKCEIIKDSLERQEMYDKNYAVKNFTHIHDLFKNVMIFSCIFVALILFICPNYINIGIKAIIVVLYIILCTAYFVYSYASIGSKICWIIAGIMCFAPAFLI